jgi:hypothetical protein
MIDDRLKLDLAVKINPSRVSSGDEDDDASSFFYAFLSSVSFFFYHKAFLPSVD